MKKTMRSKRLLTLALVGNLFLFSQAAFAAPAETADFSSQAVSVVVNGSKLNLSPEAVIESGRTFVPLDQVFEVLGANVDWNENLKIITVNRGSATIKMQIDYHKIAIADRGNVEYKNLDAAPQIIDGSIYVPLEAVAPALNAQVGWDAAANTASITAAKTNVTAPYNGYASFDDYANSTSQVLLYGSQQIRIPMFNSCIKPLLPAEVTGTNYGKGTAVFSSNPSTSGLEITDMIIDEILAGIIKPDMTDEQKWKAVYDYLIYHYQHNKSYVTTPKFSELREYVHGEMLYKSYSGNALTLLYTGEGVCDDFAALYTCMMWRLGYDSEVVNGNYVNRDGSQSPHSWSAVTLNGTKYYFDPDVETKLYMKGIKPSYFLFKQTEAECKTNHIW